MGQTNCWANKNSKNDPDEQIDMKKAQKRDEERKKRKEKRLSAKRKKRQNKGTNPEEQPIVIKPEYDEEDPDSLLPYAPTLVEWYDKKIDHGYLLKSREKAIEYFKEIKNEEWKLETEAEDVELYTRSTSAPSQLFTKRVMSVNRSVADVAAYMQDLDKDKAAKYNWEKLVEVRNLSHDSRIIHFGIKGSLLLGARDFCSWNTKYKLNNGNVLIINHAIECDNVPIGKPIRGNFECINLLRPVTDEQTIVTNVSFLDMKGSIPTSILQRMVEKQHDEFVLLKDGMEN